MSEPRTVSPRLQRVGRGLLRLMGWRCVGAPPGVTRAVVLCGQHSSNWDFVLGLFGMWAFGLWADWIGKDSLFRGPLGWLMRASGGIPVDRSTRHGFVGEVARKIRDGEAGTIVIAPEGTRSYTPMWKSGFYRIAEQANAPIVLGFLDYPTKTCGFGTLLHPSGDVAADMEKIRAFYATTTPRYPERCGPIRLADEEPP